MLSEDLARPSLQCSIFNYGISEKLFPEILVYIYNYIIIITIIIIHSQMFSVHN
jgi:hypothetical protein